MFCFVFFSEVPVTNWAAQKLQYQPNGWWNLWKVHYREWIYLLAEVACFPGRNGAEKHSKHATSARRLIYSLYKTSRPSGCPTVYNTKWLSNCCRACPPGWSACGSRTRRRTGRSLGRGALRGPSRWAGTTLFVRIVVKDILTDHLKRRDTPCVIEGLFELPWVILNYSKHSFGELYSWSIKKE